MQKVNSNDSLYFRARCQPCYLFLNETRAEFWPHEHGVKLFQTQNYDDSRTLTETKKKLGRHEVTSNHITSISKYKNCANRELEVACNIATIALSNIELGLSDRSFEQQILTVYTLNVDVGDKGHGKDMMPRWKSIMFSLILKNLSKIIRQPSCNIFNSFCRFIGLSLDKYSLSHISQQMICLRIIMDGEMKVFPIGFIQTSHNNEENAVCIFQFFVRSHIFLSHSTRKHHCIFQKTKFWKTCFWIL